MALTTDSLVRVLEVCKISPPETESATELSLPLTFFDTYVFCYHPVEYIFSYELTTDSSSFLSSIVPKLKNSLSLTLLHFLPLAGNLVWPPHSDKPFIFYTPGDGVSLTIAESRADFDYLSGDTVREVPDSHLYVPQLAVSETKAEKMAFQVTVFPNKGFCLGVSFNHAVIDGRSFILLLKAWAYMCKHLERDNGSPTLPPELTPFLDRTIIKEPQPGLDMVFLNHWMNMMTTSSSGQHTNLLSLFPKCESIKDRKLVRSEFSLSREDIQKIRKKTVHQMDQPISKEGRNHTKSKQFSNFVLTFAYVAINAIKARGLEGNKPITLAFVCDVRERLDPPIPGNYWGNCLTVAYFKTKIENVIKEEGLSFVDEELTNFVKGFEKGALNRVKENFEDFRMGLKEKIAIASSPRFGVYSH